MSEPTLLDLDKQRELQEYISLHSEGGVTAKPIAKEYLLMDLIEEAPIWIPPWYVHIHDGKYYLHKHLSVFGNVFVKRGTADMWVKKTDGKLIVSHNAEPHEGVGFDYEHDFIEVHISDD